MKRTSKARPKARKPGSPHKKKPKKAPRRKPIMRHSKEG